MPLIPLSMPTLSNPGFSRAKLSKQCGTTLIETMVALFILAIGLLGVIAMQANGLKSSQRSQYSSQVHVIANDMMDRIYAYDNVDETTDDDDFDGLDTKTAIATAPSDCVAAVCDAAAQRALAQWDWQEAIKANLPSGIGKIVWNAARSSYTITVLWDNEDTGATGEDCGTDPTVDLACYRVEMRL